MRVFAIAVSALSLLVAGHAAAADKVPESKEERVVCRTQKVTGTRFSKRVCRSAAEWQEAGERSRDALQEQMSRPIINRQGEAPNGIGE